MSGLTVSVPKAQHRRAGSLCLGGDGVSSSVKAGSSQGCRTEGNRSLNIHHGLEMSSARPGKHIFVCSLHPSELPSITPPGAIWGEQDQPAQFGCFLQTPLHPTASITLPRAASGCFQPRHLRPQQSQRRQSKLCGPPFPGT